MILKKTELREVRDFGQKFNAVFTFVQNNFKSFIKVIGLTVGPLALLGGLFYGLFYSEIFGGIFSGSTFGSSGEIPGFMSVSPDTISWAAEMFMAYLFLGMASLWMTIAVYAFMAEYDSGNENITIEAVWKRGKGKIMPVIGAGMLTILVMVIFVVIIFILPGNESGGWIALKALLLCVVIFYIAITLSLLVPNMVIENAGVFESIERCFILIHGKWWSTFGLLMVMGFVSNIATMIFAIPFYVGMIVKMVLQTNVGDILTVAGSCILFLGSFLMMTLPALAVGFQYFNLVERKEGIGLLKKIDLLGKQGIE